MTIIQQPAFIYPANNRDKRKDENSDEHRNTISKENLVLFSKELGISVREFNSALEKSNFTNLRQTIFNTLELIFKRDESKLEEIKLLRNSYH